MIQHALRLLVLCLAFLGLQLTASENLSSLQENMKAEFLLLTDRIQSHHQSGTDSSKGYLDRANLLLVAEEFVAAIDDFTFLIDLEKQQPGLDKVIVNQSLWGRMFGYACLGREAEFMGDWNAIRERMPCQHLLNAETPDGHEIFLCKDKKKDKKKDKEDTNDRNQDEHGYDPENPAKGINHCLQTVENTVDYITRLIIKNVRDRRTQDKLRDHIYQLSYEARQCCYGTDWNICLEPMAQQINQWQKYGYNP